MLEIILLVYGAVCVVTGIFSGFLAKEKNYNPGAWFILGILFSLVALIAIAGAPKKED